MACRRQFRRTTCFLAERLNYFKIYSMLIWKDISYLKSFINIGWSNQITVIPFEYTWNSYGQFWNLQSLMLLFILCYALLLGVLALSWYPPDSSDENGEATDHLVPTIMDKAHKYNLKVFNLFSNYFYHC